MKKLAIFITLSSIFGLHAYYTSRDALMQINKNAAVNEEPILNRAQDSYAGYSNVGFRPTHTTVTRPQLMPRYRTQNIYRR